MEERDNTDMEACHRSNNGELLICSDERGRVRLFNYPAIKKGAATSDGVGHSAHVTNVRFDLNDQYAFSVGGTDRCVFQWKLVDRE